jgi:hypothetical protein
MSKRYISLATNLRPDRDQPIIDYVTAKQKRGQNISALLRAAIENLRREEAGQPSITEVAKPA